MTDPSIERFRRVLRAAHAHLDARRKEVNDLNVFPVADGDTGDNMVLTLRAALDELDRLDGQAVDEIGRTELVNALARAALMGARGNSGVILSQIVRGAAEELASRRGELVDPVLVASAMAKAADAAYDSVREPAEGTMLTVFREMAHSVSRRIPHMEQARLNGNISEDEQDELLAALLEEAVADGEKAVARTPEQLEVLRESGVVDAGAHGLVLLLAGIVAGLRDDAGALPEVATQEPAKTTRPQHADSRFRYCTNFIVTGRDLDGGRAFVPRLEEIGDSVLVVGDEATLKVHVHTDAPESAMAIFQDAGEVSQVDNADMREQIAERAARLEAARCAAVAVCSGEGMRELFEGLGAYVVEGGATLNPSISDLLAAIHEVRAEEVVVLPNNPNVIMAAERACELSDKQARVVPCNSQQAGLVALVELDVAGALDDNAERLVSALDGVRVGSVAPAARDDAQGRFVAGDAVGFVDDEIVAWGGAGSVLRGTLASLGEGAEIVTVIGGAGAPIELANVEAHAPKDTELELHEGDNPATGGYWPRSDDICRPPPRASPCGGAGSGAHAGALSNLMALLDEVIDAHGGRRRWKRSKQLKAHVRSGGLLPRMKRKSRKIADYSLIVNTGEQRAFLDPYPEEGQRGVFDAGDVRIESSEGELLEEREGAREMFFGAHGIQRKLRWDDLDMLYFVGYAMWNYMTMPFLFDWPGVESEEGEPLEEDGETLRRLDLRFPETVHTHCADQTVYLGDDGLICRHDYHPDVVASLANGVHLSTAYGDCGGLTLATSRKVVPRSPIGSPLPAPTVVWIELDELERG